MTDTKQAKKMEVISRALGDMAQYEPPDAKPSIGPSFPDIAEDFKEQHLALCEKLDAHLEPWTVEGLQAEFLTKGPNGFYRLEDPHGLSCELVQQIIQLRSQKPAWFISGWHVKPHEVDVGYWRAFNSCSLPELTLLSLGLDPRKITYDALFTHYGHSDAQDQMLYFVEDVNEAIANGLNVDPDGDQKVDLRVFDVWRKSVGFSLENRFTRLLREKFRSAAGAAKVERAKREETRDARQMHANRYNFHAKLLHSIAVEKFGLGKDREISSAAKAMQLCAELQGHNVSRAPIVRLLETGQRMHIAEE